MAQEEETPFQSLMAMAKALEEISHATDDPVTKLLVREKILELENSVGMGLTCEHAFSAMDSLNLAYTSTTASAVDESQEKENQLVANVANNNNKNSKKKRTNNNKNKKSSTTASLATIPEASSTSNAQVAVFAHYGATKKKLNLKLKYEAWDCGFKPYGLWLSDEAASMHWRKWCIHEEHEMRKLEFKTKVTVNASDDLFLLNGSDPAAVQVFHDAYGIDHMTVDWGRVVCKYKGILVTPYDRSRFDFLGGHGHLLWFACFDCASACIWDLSCVQNASSVDCSRRATL